MKRSTSLILLAALATLVVVLAATSVYAETNKGMYILIDRLSYAAKLLNVTGKVEPILADARKALDSGNFTLARQLLRDAMRELRIAAQSRNVSVAKTVALSEAIKRAEEFAARLESIAKKNNVSIDLSDARSKLAAARSKLAAGDFSAAAKLLAEARKELGRAESYLMRETRPIRAARARVFLAKTVKMLEKRIELARQLGLPNDTVQALEKAKQMLLRAAKFPTEGLVLSIEKMRMKLARSFLEKMAHKLGVKLPQPKSPVELARMFRKFEESGMKLNATRMRELIREALAHGAARKHAGLLGNASVPALNVTVPKLNVTLTRVIEMLRGRLSLLSNKTRPIAERVVGEAENATRAGNAVLVAEKIRYAKMAISALVVADRLLEKAEQLPEAVSAKLKQLADKIISAVKDRKPLQVIEDLVKQAKQLLGEEMGEHTNAPERSGEPGRHGSSGQHGGSGRGRGHG